MTQSVRSDLPTLEVEQSTIITAGLTPILIVRTRSGLRACSAICPHQNRTLEGAIVRAETVVCPWHGASFSLDDGRSLSPVTKRGLSVFPCEEEGGTLTLHLSI